MRALLMLRLAWVRWHAARLRPDAPREAFLRMALEIARLEARLA